MFGTELKKNKQGIDQDVCSGDSGDHVQIPRLLIQCAILGGPLMFGDTSSGTEKFVLIGNLEHVHLVIYSL